eukprot:2504179-Amphidinium_carterae.1
MAKVATASVLPLGMGLIARAVAMFCATWFVCALRVLNLGYADHEPFEANGQMGNVNPSCQLLRGLRSAANGKRGGIWLAVITSSQHVDRLPTRKLAVEETPRGRVAFYCQS